MYELRYFTKSSSIIISVSHFTMAYQTAGYPV